MEQKKKIHHGNFISQTMNRSPKLRGDIVKDSGYSKTTVYRWLKEEKIDMFQLDVIISACDVDVKGECPELDYYRKNLKQVPEFVPNKENTVPKDNYLKILEEMNEVRSQLAESQALYMSAKERVFKLEKELENRDKAGTNEG